MQAEDRKKYEYECFTKLLPYINTLLEKVVLSEELKEYSFNKIPFLMRLNKFEDAIEISMARERPIFPTLAFSKQSEGVFKLLHYRVSYNDFRSELNKAIDDGSTTEQSL